MSKRLILILALAFVVGIAVSAYAAVQNVKVSGDILVEGVKRSTFELDSTNEKDGAILSGIRVRVDADLTDNVATTVRLLNEREWGHEGTSTDADDSDIDLDLGYVTLKEFLYSPLSVTVGRQELRYGNALIIGDVDSNGTATATSGLPTRMNDLSLRKSFDAVKAVLNYDPLVVDLVYSKIEENTSNRADDVNLIGLNANYTVNKDLLVEGYVWSRDRQYNSTGLAIAAGTAGVSERLNVVGARGVYTGIENLTLGLEGAWEFGDHVASTILYPDETRTGAHKSDVDAYAIQFMSNYVFPKVKYTPAVAFNYTRLSGEKDRVADDNYTGWSPMYEDQAGGTIFNKIVGFSNCQLINLGGSLKPMEDLAVKLDWYHIRLLQVYNDDSDDTRTLSGVNADPTFVIRGGKRHLADEIDLGLTYDYTEDVQLGLSGGIYFPGQVYDKENRRKASQIIGSMKVTF